MHVGGAAHGAIGAAGEADKRHMLALQYRDQRQNLVGLAAVRDGEHHIAAADHAQVAVAGFAWMHEKGGRAGTGEGGGHFLADMARLAHAHDDDFALAAIDHLAGAGKVVVNILVQLLQTFTLDAQYRFSRRLKVEIRV